MGSLESNSNVQKITTYVTWAACVQDSENIHSNYVSLQVLIHFSYEPELECRLSTSVIGDAINLTTIKQYLMLLKIPGQGHYDGSVGKVPIVKPGHLSSTTRTHMLAGKNQLQIALGPP